MSGYAAAGGRALPSGSESLVNIVTGHYALPAGDLLTGLYGLFIKPVYVSSAGFFQISPISLFALLAYAVPVPMLFALTWFMVAGFRFATSCWESYHFWIPVVEYIWYMQYTIFPL